MIDACIFLQSIYCWRLGKIIFHFQLNSIRFSSILKHTAMGPKTLAQSHRAAQCFFYLNADILWEFPKRVALVCTHADICASPSRPRRRSPRWRRPCPGRARGSSCPTGHPARWRQSPWRRRCPRRP